MNEPAPDARPSSLHRRLTVALAPAADRSRLADALTEALADGPARAQLLRSGDLRAAVEASAALRAGDRAELCARVEAAAGRADDHRAVARRGVDDLLAHRDRLLEESGWARQAGAELEDRRRLVAEARNVLDARAVSLREAHGTLERVLEQRAATAAAIEEADRELGDMTSAAMDEPGLRREMEVAMRSVRNATAALRSAREDLAAIEAEQSGIAAELAAASGRSDAPPVLGSVDAALVERVLDAYDAFRADSASALTSRRDPIVGELIDAWCDLNADFEEARAGSAPVPTAEALQVAAAELEAATLERQRAEQQVVRRVITAQERAAIEAAHAAVLAAEERTGRRFGSGVAQAHLEAARLTERALLDEHGFASYLEVTLTGGRAGMQNAALAAAEQRYVTALTSFERMQQASASPTITYLESERERLRLHTADVLGVDPGDAAVHLLERHPIVSSDVVHELRDALAAVGIRPVGSSLGDAAEAWLEEQRAVAERQVELDATRGGDRDRLAELEARAGELADLEQAARRTLSEAEETLDLAQRSVDAFEAELSVRAGEDTKRLKRLAAAEQLRAQVEAVEGTLARAEAAARAGLEHAMTDHAAAEVAFDQASTAVADLARKARALAAELPSELCPSGDLLDSLDPLASALQVAAADMQADLDRAEADLAVATGAHEDSLAAVAAAKKAASGPQVDDFVDGLAQLLARAGQDVLVLDEPFEALEPGPRAELLGVLRDGSAGRQVVLITEDPDLLGWAIELPADVGTAVPADALLTRVRRQPSDEPVNLTDDLTDDLHTTAARPAGRT